MEKYIKKFFVCGLVLSPILFVLEFLFWHINSIIKYNDGLYCFDKSLPYHGFWFMYAMAYLCIYPILVVFIAFTILFLLYKLRVKNAVVLTLIFSLSLCGAKLIRDKYLPGCIYFMAGFECNIKKNIPLAEIKKGLSIATQEHIYDRSKWPSILNTLSPNNNRIGTTKDNKNYICFEWGGPSGHYGFAVGADSNSVPAATHLASEYRKDVEEDVFIWHELKTHWGKGNSNWKLKNTGEKIWKLEDDGK
jgi:hypothetical protein